jgi:transposase-like protein
MVAAVFRTILAQPDPDMVASGCDQVRDQLGERFLKIGPLIDDARSEILAFSAFPRAHWTKMWSTNPLERLDKEVTPGSRRGHFPNEARDPIGRRRPCRHTRRLASGRAR